MYCTDNSLNEEIPRWYQTILFCEGENNAFSIHSIWQRRVRSRNFQIATLLPDRYFIRSSRSWLHPFFQITVSLPDRDFIRDFQIAIGCRRMRSVFQIAIVVWWRKSQTAIVFFFQIAIDPDTIDLSSTPCIPVHSPSGSIPIFCSVRIELWPNQVNIIIDSGTLRLNIRRASWSSW